MAQKEVGYVELEWTCPQCKTRNPGTQTVCGTCGAAQPKDVAFEAPAQAELAKDADKVKQAQSGPDIHCGFCGARNPATAKICHQCGGDLTQGKARAAGQVVGAYSAAPGPDVTCTACGTVNSATAKSCTKCGAPLGRPVPTPAAAPAPKASGGRNLAFIAIAILVVVGLCAMLFFMFFRTSGKTAEATGTRWERSIEVLGLTPVRDTAWQDQVPSEAANVQCRSEVRSTSDQPEPGAKEVCGTPYTLDTGTGMGKVVQDCEYQVYDDMCTFTTQQWGVISVARADGVGFSPEWPAANLVGNQRLGNRNERYECVVSDDQKEYSFTLNSQEEYERCEPGTTWKIEVNSFGDVVAAELAR